jgi:hypothetical protein
MKKVATLLLLLVFVVLPALAQIAQYQGRLSDDDQKRFDSYYQRWLEYKRTNNHDEILSMEKRMQDVMQHYGIPARVPYEAITSSGSWGNYQQYLGRFSRDDQARFDSYYERWLNYKRTDNRPETLSMERRMQDVMSQYNVPLTVPFRALTSSSSGNYGGGYWNQWRGRLQAEDQGRFDSYYQRWLDYKRTNNREEIISMENRMQGMMRQYNIPGSVPFDKVASSSVAQPAYHGDLSIVDATYGSGRRVANVTTQLQALIQGGRLSLNVNNDSMGGDPAPEVHKALEVIYLHRGRERRVTIPEGGTLNIP